MPHARDERRFDPARFDREATRARLGVRPGERLLLFGGTPRAHKGVVEVLEALERLGDDRYRVLMFGTREFDELKPRIGDLARWARVLPAQPFDDLPELVDAADLACVVQDPAHPVSRYQMPAKVSDALAMGVPCLVTRTPPLAPLADAGVLQVLEAGEELHERIARVFDDPDDARARAGRGRELFLQEYSYEAVAERLTPVFEGLLADPPPVSARQRELAEAPGRIWKGSYDGPTRPSAGAAPGDGPTARPGPPAPPGRPSAGPATSTPTPAHWIPAPPSTWPCSGSRTTPGSTGAARTWCSRSWPGRRGWGPSSTSTTRSAPRPSSRATGSAGARPPTSAASWPPRAWPACCADATSPASTDTRSCSAATTRAAWADRTGVPTSPTSGRCSPATAWAPGGGRSWCGPTRPTTTCPASSTPSPPTWWWPTSSTTTAPGTSPATPTTSGWSATTRRCWPAATS
ncbi:MAG: glycosyltransferase [Acidimicrobiales bacterium]